MENGNATSKEWDEKKLSLAINNCINIEKNIKIINAINAKIKKQKNRDIHINFFLEDNEMNNKIKNFGKLNTKKFKYELRECPIDIPKSKRYEIFNRERNKIIKTGKREWIGILCEKKLRKKRIHYWKISVKKHMVMKFWLKLPLRILTLLLIIKEVGIRCLCCGNFILENHIIIKMK